MKWEDIFKTYLVDTLNFVKSVGTEASTQGQLYIQELIKWEIISHVVYTLFCIALLSLSIFVINKIKTISIEDDPRDRSLSQVASLIAITATVIVFSIPISINVSSVLKAYYSPRVVVIEKLQVMLK